MKTVMKTIEPIRAFTDNYIWCLCNGQGQAVVVDPGEAQPVLEYLHAHGLDLTAILATHHHPDHVGGISELLEHYTGAGLRQVPVYGPAHESIPGRTVALEDGQSYRVPGLDEPLWVLEVPGHTAGHVALYQPGEPPGEPGLLFSGDTLFSVGCGRLFEGTAEQMQHSLSRLRSLPDNTLLYCGHEYTMANCRFALHVEPANRELHSWMAEVERRLAAGMPSLPAILGTEKQVNPFLRWDEPQVMEQLHFKTRQTISDPVAVFAAVRSWKDQF